MFKKGTLIVPAGTAYVDVTFKGDVLSLNSWGFLQEPSLSEPPYILMELNTISHTQHIRRGRAPQKGGKWTQLKLKAERTSIAFDRIWGPAILLSLDKKQCPRYLMKISSFLRDRKATLECAKRGESWCPVWMPIKYSNSSISLEHFGGWSATTVFSQFLYCGLRRRRDSGSFSQRRKPGNKQSTNYGWYYQ